MTKREILDEFNDINYVYNNTSKHETLSWMLDELLNEQEAVPVDTKMIGMPNGTDIEVFCCPDCRMVLDESFHFCPNCGQAVKWDD